MNRLIRYLCVGGICFLVDFSIFFVLAKLGGYHYLAVNVLSFSVATVCNYFLCILFVFESGGRYGRKAEFILLFFISCISLAFNQVFLYSLVSIMAVEILLAKALSVVATFMLNYFGRSSFVFRRR